MAEWFFRAKTPGELNREPVESEFFATDAISDPGMALVREAIQNSLDERRADEDTVLVRIRLSGPARAVPRQTAEAFLCGAWEHLAAEGNGLMPGQLPAPDEPCSYVVIEDFGTTGLEGDPGQPFQPPDDRKNKFYHFFRAEGQSDKEAADRGSWGVGKCVFTRSSRINGMFGFSVRESDGARLLMGKITLKSHWLDGDYCQEGFFGIPPEGGSGLVMPVHDVAVLDGFCDAFDLQRGMEPGLSVVVPWPWEEITQEKLVEAVLRDYFWPIMAGQLEVVVETPDVEACLEADSILAEARAMEDGFAAEHIPLLEFAQWAISLPEEERVEIGMPDPGARWQWSGDLVTDELADSMGGSFEEYRPIAVRVPVTVRPREGKPQRSFFDVYFRRAHDAQRDRPTFIREGLIIPNVNAPRTRGVIGLVVVEDGPLAEFLRDAENPSHTEWQHDGSKFRGKYISGGSDLEFVKRGVHELVKILTEADTTEDRTVLADVFSIPADVLAVPAGESGGVDKGDEPEEQPPPIPPPKPQAFTITRIGGGFRVAGVPTRAAPSPAALEVRVAYDTRRGDPLRRYDPADFALDDGTITLDAEGLEVIDRGENRLLARVVDPEFGLTVTGFDPNRDLYIRAEGRQLDDAR